MYKNFIFYDTLALMNEYISLLRSEPVVRRLSIVQFVVYFGAWFSNVAIYTLLLKMDVSAEVVAFVAMLHFLAGVIQAPFSGSFIDSVKPKQLLIGLIIIQFFSTISLLFVKDVGDLNLLYILILIKMAAASFYFTTEMSLLPRILPSSKLQVTNELHSIIWSFSYTLGMAISGFLVYMFGVSVAFVLDAMMFVLSLFLLFNLEIKVVFVKTGESLLSMMSDSLRYMKQNPHAIHLMMIHAFVGFSVFDALVALMVDNYYAGIIATSLALGLLHASRAFGLIIGPLFLQKLTNSKGVVYIFLLQGLAVWLWAFVMKNFYMSIGVSVLVGLFTTTLWSYTYTLLQKNIDKKYYGRIVAYNDMLFLSTAAFTSFMIGVFAKYGYSLEFIAFVMGITFMVGGVYFKWIVKTQKIKG